MSTAGWIAALEANAPDVIASWRALDPSWSGVRAMRRQMRARVREGDAPRILEQQEAIGDALESVLRSLADESLRAPGGEEDWNVAQAFAHTTAARRFLAAWAAMAAAGQWPAEAPPTVTPSVPGAAEATREHLLGLLDKSRRSLRESAEHIRGHETERCPLVHPLIGRLRCGDWLLFVGVHDLMHLEQLHRLAGDAAT
ncbi:MAG: DinB family protein [Candidatus Limnocylindria bacterium]